MVLRTVAGPSNESFRERPCYRRRQIADAKDPSWVVESTKVAETEVYRVEFPMMDAHKARPGWDRFGRYIPVGEIWRMRGRIGAMRRHADRMLAQPI